MTHFSHLSSSIRAFAISCIVAACVLSIFDYLFLPSYSINSLNAVGKYMVLPLILCGNLIPTLIVSGFLLMVMYSTFCYLSYRIQKARIVFGFLVILAASPWSIWLAVFTFSGEGIRDLALRPYLVGISAVFFILLFLLYCIFFVYRFRKKPSISAGLVLLCSSILPFWINKEIYPNEYEPLHIWVSSWSILLSLSGSREICAAYLPLIKMSSRVFYAIIAAAIVLSLSVQVVLSSREVYTWTIFGTTCVSRYISTRIEFLRNWNRDIESTDTFPAILIKPDIETPETWVERKKRADEPAPNIVLFFVDNVQANHVGAYGYKKNPVTPNLDKLATKSVLFERAYSSFPQTRCFMSALLVGRYIPSFGEHRMPKSYVTNSVTNLLKKRNYHTFVRGWFEGAKRSSFDPQQYRIDTFFRPMPKNHPLRKKNLKPWYKMTEDDKLKKIDMHLDEAKRSRKPFFIWIHLVHPHWKGNGFLGKRKSKFGKNIIDKYDSAISETDDWYKRLKSIVDKKDSDRKTIWVFGSDHGAGIGKNKSNFGKTIYEYHTRVPLIISAPGYAAKRVSTLVDSSLDIAATVLDFAGIDPPSTYGGISLVPFMNNAINVDRFIPLSYSNKYKGAVYKKWKIVERNKSYSLYNIAKDPEERTNIANKHSDLMNRMISTTNKVLTERIENWNAQ